LPDTLVSCNSQTVTCQENDIYHDSEERYQSSTQLARSLRMPTDEGQPKDPLS